VVNRTASAYRPPGKVSDRHGPEPQRHHRIERTERIASSECSNRLAILSRERKAAAEMPVGPPAEFRIEIDRPAK
jgi:hypothetical protein